MSEVPSVKVLEAINPANSGTGEDELAYTGLSAAVERYRQSNYNRSMAMWEAEPDSLEELSKARQLASEYLLRNAEKAVQSRGESRDLWSARFTAASIELYGGPEQVEVRGLIADEYAALSNLRERHDISQDHLELLLDAYRPIVAMAQTGEISATRAEAEREREAVHQFGEAMYAKYQPLFGLVDEAEKDAFTAADLRELFTKALDWLQENDDPTWSDWEVISADGTSLSVLPASSKIKIASRRETASSTDARGLLAHELLIHAARAKNGRKTGDRKLATGLPGYLDAEEGLGILAEAAVNGELPDKASDRYVDIALALGTVDGVQRSRRELFQISYARQLIRAQLRGADNETVQALAPRVWGHIDRIYRGGPGNGQAAEQAVFTKDIAYYVGYKQMAQYLVRQLEAGKTAGEVLNYLSQGKFDPTNRQHEQRVAQTTSLAE